jgi:hypothetical protein
VKRLVALSWFAVACHGADDDCPQWDDPVTKGSIAPGPIDEPSGLAVSPVEPGVLWTHNDAGDEARLFALDSSGALLREYFVSGVTMGDWEDLAVVGDTLWIADLGIDAGSPPLLVAVPLPVVGAGDDEAGVIVPDAVLPVTFPGTRPDVEAIFHDAATDRMVLVSRAIGELTEVFTLDLADGAATRTVALAFGRGALDGDGEVTGAAVTADGATFALRTRSGAFAWERGSGDLDDAFEADPCPVPVGATSGGEAMSFDRDGRLFLLGDGEEAAVVETAR